ncbi:hypothetical protein GGTG_00949 [Gaeumannomyces tritici R3-111a-1]|uniref:Uncharacterized protein n=1 Tax=Gaeumannomyces tritici (strain R3-111a-1) TaxID=644352 RepID=J3NI66_GAET3|nr:hypothetical protein GGTG_00949 [Gaeumannomyces tritici R3-111a-1]EJT80959.1 hypothetical protein GGTG_00949 [Gaeumannomyces tritici R3-111a-1]
MNRPAYADPAFFTITLVNLTYQRLLHRRGGKIIPAPTLEQTCLASARILVSRAGEQITPSTQPFRVPARDPIEACTAGSGISAYR